MSKSNGNGKKNGKAKRGQLGHVKKNELKWIEGFLGELQETANVSHSARAAGITRSAVYVHRDADEEFEKRWDEALEQGIAALEVEVRRRALHGTDDYVFGKDDVVIGTRTKYSDTLAIFLLKAHRPEVYRERSDVNITHGGQVEFRLGGMTPEQSIEKLDADLDRLGLRR